MTSTILFYGYEWQNILLFLLGPLSLFIFIYATYERINKLKYILYTTSVIFFIVFLLSAKKPKKIDLNYYKNKTFLLEDIERQIPFILNEEKKPIILYFYADWCHSCKDLEERLSNLEIGELIQKGWTIIKIDVSDYQKYEDYLYKTYHIYGIPALTFFYKDRTIIKPFTMIGVEYPKSILISILKQFGEFEEIK